MLEEMLRRDAKGEASEWETANEKLQQSTCARFYCRDISR